ncbi:MAG: ABC transporter ATP-binding protein [Candidatus Thorarchaeota archaeon]|nr:MAG: nitrate ABC transporter ATP-binding protein [Candidatus Thorarchaeota archaeon]RLI58075.1 MAG: nitrate ABC transporter ATP-binding protein [Candidatus Thorarchaeota archaeon]
MPTLSVRNIHKSFPNGDGGVTEVLGGVSFDLENGEFLSLLGTSGCGKTTLLKIIAGLLEPDKGEVLIDGEVVGPGHNKVGYIFQQESLFPWRTVRQNIEFGLEVAGVSLEERKSAVDRIIEIVRMQGLEDNYPHEISGGQARKTELARSLVVEPHILVSDEALSNLDAQTRNYLQTEFLRIKDTIGTTVLFVSHNVDETVFMSDRILVMSNMPAKIIAEYEIDIPKPRTRTSPNCLSYRSKILDVLRKEQEKALEQETRLARPAAT